MCITYIIIIIIIDHFFRIYLNEIIYLYLY